MTISERGIMNAEDGFLQDILAHPDDDAPRLVFADWLDENGDPERAEFIRVQIRRLRTPLAEDYANEDEISALRRREGYLLAKQQAAWRDRLKTGQVELKLVRGFVEGVLATAEQWQRVGRKVQAASPVRHLKLFGAGKKLAALLKSPTLDRLTRLDLNGNELGDDGVRAVAGCERLAGLTRLDLANNKLTDAGAQALALSAHLANLTVLDLSVNGVGDGGARALAASPHLTHLVELYLADNGIGDAGAQALAGSANLAGLRELILFVNEIGSAGARALTGSPHLKGLEKLYLNQNRLSAQMRKSLEKSWGERISCAPSR
jgi:uncharacterized protein (TIGR02996 family)